MATRWPSEPAHPDPELDARSARTPQGDPASPSAASAAHGTPSEEANEVTARKTNPYSTMKETLMSDPSHEATGLDIPNFPLLTAMTNGLRGLWVVGGSTGRGKSTLAANIVANVAKPGIEVYYLDLENDTGVVTREIGDRIASAYGINHPSLDQLRGYRRLGDLEHDMGHYLVPPALIVVDHIQLLAKGEDGSQRRASLDGIVRRCQEWALDGYTVLALSQLGRGA